jgi:arylsulfatase A-like enzyme
MKRRQLLQSTAVAVASVVATACRRSANDPPNLLVIGVDDLNAWVNALNPSQTIITPWIDRLAARGTVFEHAYCAAPYCNASRMAVFTGCWPSTTGIYKDEPYWSQPKRKPTFIEALRREHYRVFSAGKVFHGRYNYAAAKAQGLATASWIEQENRAWLWDQAAPTAPEPLIQPFPANGLERDVNGKPWSAQFDWGRLSPAQESQHPDVLTAEAVARFLRQPDRQPFLAMAGFYKPHLPWYAPQRWLDRYPLDQIELPPQLASDLNDVPPTAQQWAQSPPDDATLTAAGLSREAVRAYKASISFADEQIGRVLEALWSSPQASNTIVALWSDNGFHLGEKLHWRKFTLWEEATRVPLIIADPQGGPYRPRVAAPVSLIDLFPTLLDLAGLPAMPGVDGHSLKALMKGSSSTAQTPALMSWGAGNNSIRQGPWRYIRYRAGGEELYNHDNDPLEHHNLATEPSQRRQLLHLRRELDQALTQHRD